MLNLQVGTLSVSVANCVMTVSDPAKGTSVPLTFAAPSQAELAARLLAKQVAARDEKFATDIAYAKNPSPKQIYWVNEMLKKAQAAGQTVAPKPTNPTIDVTKIVAMFQQARQALKRPKITLVLDVNQPQHLVRVAFDEARGVMWLNSESFGQNYGRIVLSTGALQLKDYGRANQTQLMALLNQFAADPIPLAIAHGKLTGNCMFCQLKLTDERSLNHGYGKRCARNWHLPWGDRPNFSAVTHWALGDK